MEVGSPHHADPLSITPLSPAFIRRAGYQFSLICLCISVPLITSTNHLYAADTDKWNGKLSIELKAGSDQQIGTVDALVPLWQRQDRLVFADIRFVDTDGAAAEGNFGIGYRQAISEKSSIGGDWAWGIYGFADRSRTPTGNYFSQISAGAEIFSENWSLRGNVYYPERDSNVIATQAGGFDGLALNGTAVVLQQSASLEAREYALPGVDLELGRRFSLSSNQEIWLYGAYFHFDRSQTPVVEGPRFRAEYRLYDVLNVAGSELSFGAEVQHDDIRKTDESFVARLRIPFGKAGKKKRSQLSQNIVRRMTEYVVRDRDIIALAQDINQPVGSELGPELAAGSTGVTGTTAVTDPTTGEQLDVFIVDNTGGGNCTQNSPCTVAAAQANASYGTGDIIIVTDSSGAVVSDADLTAGAQTARRQLVGGAATVNIALSSGDSLALTGLGSRPTVNGTVTLANESIVRNLNIASPGIGLAANGITSATVDDVTISSAATTGINIQNTSGTVTVSNSSISNTATAVSLQTIGGNFNFTNTTISNSTAGVDLGGAATNANLTYQGGSINAGVPVNTVGIVAGNYDFTGTTITKNNALSTATGFGGDFIFVDATGGGTGTSNNRASADFAETNSNASDIIVLTDDGTGNILATNGLQLQNSQQLIGFAAGPATVDFTGSNANVLGNFQYQISDPTGNGAATLSNSGGTEVVTLADGNQVRDFNLSTSGAVDGIAGNGFTGATISNLALANTGADAFDFTNAAGTVTINNASATNSAGNGLRVSGGNATYAFNNVDISDTATGRSVDISTTTGGSASFDVNSAITNSSGSGLLIDNIGGNVTFNGGVSVTGATSDALTATNLNANSVNFNGALGIATTTGNGITASGGTLNVASTGTTISAGTGSAIDLSNLTVGNGSGGALTFNSLSSSGGANGIALSNVNATNGLTINNATLASNTTAGLNVNGVTGTLNINAANIDATGVGLAIAGTNGTLNIGNSGAGLDIDSGTTGVSINQNAGTVNLGTGASGLFAVDGTSGAGVTLAGAGTVNFGTGGGTANIAQTADTGGTAFQATGGSVDANYAGSITLASNTGLVSVLGGHNGTLTFSGALSNSAATNATQLNFNNADGTYNFDGTVNVDTTAGTGIGIDVAATSNAAIDFDNTLTIATASGNALQMAGTGSLDVSGGSLDVDATTGTGINQSAGAILLSDTTSVRASSTGTGINASGGTFAVANGAGTAEVISASGQGLLLSNVTTGTGGVTFDTINAGGGANGIALTNINTTNGLTISSATLAGNTTAGLNINGVTGTLNINAANINATGVGLAIAGTNGTLNIGNGGTGLDIDGGTTGVSINQTSGTVNLGTGGSGVFAVDGTSGAGVTLAGSGNINIGTGGGSATIGNTATTTGTAIATTGGNATFNYAGNISNSIGRLLDVQNTTGGSITVTGGTITDSGTGILVQNAAGNTAITNAALTQSSATSVTLNGNSGNFTMTNGSVTNSGATGVAVLIDNTSGTNNFTGTNLTQTSGRLIDIGATTGPTAGSITFSGGTLTSSVGTGIRVQNTAANVSVDGAVLVSSTTDAVTLSNNSGSFSLTNGTILNAAGSAILGNNTSNLTFDNVSISDAATSGNAISLTNATGTVNLLNSDITYDAVAADGLDIDNSALGAGTLTLNVDNTTFIGDTTASGLTNGIDIITSTGSTLNASITGSSFTNTFITAIEIDVFGTGGSDTVTIGASADRNTFTGVGGDVADLSAQDNSTVSFDIRGNDADGNGLSTTDGIDLLIRDSATATVDIIDNTLTDIGNGTSDTTVKVFVGNGATANSSADITVSNNSISNNTATGLVVDVFGNSDANVTVNNNTFGSNGNNDGLNVLTTTSNTEVCLAASGNSFGTDQINLTESADGSILRVPLAANATALSTANGSVTVNPVGGIGFGEACTIP